MAIRFATIDSTVSLLFAFLINAAILIVSAATFYGTEYSDVADISYAYQLLSRVLPSRWPACFLHWHCWRPGKIRRSPARWPGRSSWRVFSICGCVRGSGG